MEKQLILAMLFYVIYIWLLGALNFRTRLLAIKNKNVHHSFFKAYQGDVTDRVQVVGRHYDNQFQLPLLFFISCLTLLTLKHADLISILFAWAFILSRIGHSYEHLGKNRVIKRFFWFAGGWLIILGLWAQIAFVALSYY